MLDSVLSWVSILALLIFALFIFRAIFDDVEDGLQDFDNHRDDGFKP